MHMTNITPSTCISQCTGLPIMIEREADLGHAAIRSNGNDVREESISSSLVGVIDAGYIRSNPARGEGSHWLRVTAAKNSMRALNVQAPY